MPALLELELPRLENNVLMDDESYEDIVIMVPPFLKNSTSAISLVLLS
jgi:hypothetical protein